MKNSLLPVLFAVCALFACKRPQEDPSPNIETKQPKLIKVVSKDSLSGKIYTIKYIYDNQNRVFQTINISNNDSNVTTHTYVNKLLMSSINNKHSINYTYNANGLVTQVIQKGQYYTDTINYEYNGNNLVKGNYKNGYFTFGNYVNGRPYLEDSRIIVYDNNFNIIKKYSPANGNNPEVIDVETTYGNIDISNTYSIIQKIPTREFSQNPYNPNKNTPIGKNLYKYDVHYNSSGSIENTNEILSYQVSNGYIMKVVFKSVNYRYNNLPDGSSTAEEPEYYIVNYYYE